MVSGRPVCLVDDANAEEIHGRPLSPLEVGSSGEANFPEIGNLEHTSMWQRACISIVDDDESCRESLHALLESYDFDVQVFDSAEDLLASSDWLRSDCLIVDATLPGASGPELQTLLRARNSSIPVVFVSGYEDAELRTRVTSAGAIDCLSKPFGEDELFASLRKAMAARVT
jgi:FixJ family two-component response regulator